MKFNFGRSSWRAPIATPSKQDEIGMLVALKGLGDRDYKPAVVYDVGAAIGSWTELALAIWPDAAYVCFEPLDERRSALESLAARHRHVTFHPVAIGDKDEVLPLGLTKSLWDSSLAYPGTKSRSVQVASINTLVARRAAPPPNFLKIDVQGFEMRVLAGASNVLNNCDFVLVECQFFAFCEEMRTLDKTIARLSELGFVPYEFVDFLRRPLDGAMGQCDILFIRRNHPLASNSRWG